MRCIPVLLLVGLLAALGAAQSKLTPSEKQELARLAALEKKQQAAKADLHKHPKDASAKNKFVVLNDQLANDTMMAGPIDPKVKYPKALRLYRESLKVNPQDAEASRWVKQIEAIYKSMHRPVPH